MNQANTLKDVSVMDKLSVIEPEPPTQPEIPVVPATTPEPITVTPEPTPEPVAEAQDPFTSEEESASADSLLPDGWGTVVA